MKIREIFTEKIKELSNKYNLEPYEVYYYLGSQIDFYSHDGEYYIKINRRLVVGNPYTIGVLSLLKMLYDKENKVMSLNKLFKKMDIEPVDLNFFCEKLLQELESIILKTLEKGKLPLALDVGMALGQDVLPIKWEMFYDIIEMYMHDNGYVRKNIFEVAKEEKVYDNFDSDLTLYLNCDLDEVKRTRKMQ